MGSTGQTDRYRDFYGRFRGLRWAVRFDVRYRGRRLHEVLRGLDVPTEGARVLDVGCGAGHLLATFPASAHVVGADVSASAVAAARETASARAFASADHVVVDEDDAASLPAGPFDIVLSSHTLEHVPDDRATLAEIHRRLRPGGTLAVFVPIEEPDYVSFHVRAYSLQSIVTRIRQAGFRIAHAEGSMYVNGHVWKLLTIPSRRHWPVVGPVVDALRLTSLSALTYRGLRAADAVLYRLGFGARQALVVARRPT